ncbi:putative ABC transport system substrate-binding protein [Halanaerobium saccharolyticum]|uniref:Putative ABC transport system substrate-binding protein n=1 Tax=Halanaerobium saccharolyticum TaxID=43595 RepID=A0A4R7Z745_9FIRM|nr:ABC transporter substrate-binding protein [Halanaerobium saccharolyticum]RAK10500.1 putative ABC transport system substrate-binding protein [Halanaerobium saccharolyticum]TDW06743.1 putative ABC transport system substrate-binding protein [Halanaerobium saccharolyticum]TDX62378.1 putative ABC transport system substrate-binding protein [Halanaerobium saccharolyticum]
MKKTFSILIVLTVFLVLISSFAGAQEYRIGISQFVEHPALDAAREGFIKGLAEAGFSEENIEFIEQNAQADFATAQSIAQQFKGDNLDLILTIATPNAQAAANVITDTPVLFTAVTDPEEAGIVASMERPGGNLTGTTDMNPVAQQIELIKEFIPEITDLGVLYNPGEVNSVVQVDLVKETTAEMGINLHEGTVSNSSEVSLAASSLIGDVDAIYVPTDNIIVSALPSVLNITNQNNIPVFASENGQVRQGSIATLGIDYNLLGVQTGKMAARVLNGADPAEMAVESSDQLKLYLNKKAAENLNLEIPAAVLDRADVIYEEITQE